MAKLTPTFRAAQYEPSGVIYNYIYSIQTQIPEWTDFEINVLESNGYNKQYASQYCNAEVFGSEDKLLNETITYQGGGNYYNPVMNNPKLYEDVQIDLAYPVITMYHGGATIFTSETDFATPEGDELPSMVVIEPGIPTNVKWYKNGEIVATDVIGNPTNSFAIAVVASGNTITGYAYIYNATGIRGTFSSGLKSTPAVLNILNNGGYAGSNETVSGWTDDELGEFVVSKIYDVNGNASYIGQVAGGRVGETLASANEDLETRTNEYDGYLGTDIVEYITNGEGWELLNNEESDGLSFEIPTSDGISTIIRWNYSEHQFELVKNGEVVYSTLISYLYRSEGSRVFITWYNQNSPIEQATRNPFVFLVATSGAIVVPQYNMYSTDLGEVEYETFDNMALLEDLIEGYDPDSGQEDEKQEDPDDVEDPANDPLATGFLYAFMVDSTDMLNLADALVPDTLAQKLKADFGNNLFEFIVSYHMMPCLTNATSLNKTAIAYRGTPFLYGANNTQLMLSPITKSWYKVNCGSKVCMPQGCRQDGFENWAHANVQLYLPFIGFVHLNTADVWNKTISIVYTFDILQGTCVANVGVGNNGTIYSYEGICKYAIPFTTAVDKSNQELLSGIFSSAGAAVSIGGVVAGAASPTALMGAAGGIANAAGSFISAAEHKSVINRGGCLSGAPGWNMPRKPALIITVPDAIRPGMIYNDTTGYPCFETGQLSSWQNNYVEVASIDLKANINSDGAVPNDNELDMINSTLKGGVYV